MINRQIRGRADDWGDVARERYEDAAGRLNDASRALRGESDWVTPTLTFLGGVGVGVALGMLFTPVSGEEARYRVRETFEDVKNKASDIASGEKGYYRTGTE